MKKVMAGLALAALANVAHAAPEGKILGVAVDWAADGLPIIFASEQPWGECQGGAAYKADPSIREVKVGCWVIIDDEGVFFVMWKDGETSNVPYGAVRPCDSAATCKREVVK